MVDLHLSSASRHYLRYPLSAILCFPYSLCAIRCPLFFVFPICYTLSAVRYSLFSLFAIRYPLSTILCFPYLLYAIRYTLIIIPAAIIPDILPWASIHRLQWFRLNQHRVLIYLKLLRTYPQYNAPYHECFQFLPFSQALYSEHQFCPLYRHRFFRIF